MTTPKYIKVNGQVYKLADYDEDVENEAYDTLHHMFSQLADLIKWADQHKKAIEPHYADYFKSRVKAVRAAQYLKEEIESLQRAVEAKEEPDMEARDEQSSFEMRTRHVGPTERKPWF